MKKIISGYILEARESEQAGRLSYDEMKTVGVVRLVDDMDTIEGDDLNDAPYNCNGNIYSGKEFELEKGDYVIIMKNPNPNHL